MKSFWGLLPFLLYGIVCTLHLIFCLPPERHSARKITKCFLMPLLALCYWQNAALFSPVLFIAVLCGFLGDVLLIKPHNRIAFALGLSAFALGHVCYIMHMAKLMPRFPSWQYVVPAALCYIVGAFFLLRKLWPHLPENLAVPCLVYVLLICSMSLSAFSLMLLYGGLYATLTFVGSLLFIVSDSILSLVTFGVYETRWRDMAVMSTYILAQTLLVCGLMML